MAEPIPFSLALLVILGIIIILGLAELAVFYLVSTRTSSRLLRIAAPIAVVLLGTIWQMTSDAGNVLATSALVAAPVAAFIPPHLFPGFVGRKTEIRRIVACYLIVSLIAAVFAFCFIILDLSMALRISPLTPVLNGVVFLVGLVVDLLLVMGVYAGLERAGISGGDPENGG